jgi:hypothetical protein
MANTTNFNWETPDDTDLVKDGAAAMRTLGNSIDTSFVDLKGGTTGQVLSKASNTDLDYTWVTTDDANAIQNAIVDAKGDLIAASANDTPARLAVGANDLVLTADSTAATGLAYTGGWATWTPSIASLTQGNGTLVARYTKIGKTVHFFLRFTFGSTSALTGNLSFTLPIFPASGGFNWIVGGIYDYGVATYGAYAEVDGSTAYCRVSTTSAAYQGGAQFSATVPMTWNATDVFIFNGTYEVG